MKSRQRRSDVVFLRPGSPYWWTAINKKPRNTHVRALNSTVHAARLSRAEAIMARTGIILADAQAAHDHATADYQHALAAHMEAERKRAAALHET